MALGGGGRGGVGIAGGQGARGRGARGGAAGGPAAGAEAGGGAKGGARGAGALAGAAAPAAPEKKLEVPCSTPDCGRTTFSRTGSPVICQSCRSREPRQAEGRAPKQRNSGCDAAPRKRPAPRREPQSPASPPSHLKAEVSPGENARGPSPARYHKNPSSSGSRAAAAGKTAPARKSFQRKTVLTSDIISLGF